MQKFNLTEEDREDIAQRVYYKLINDKERLLNTKQAAQMLGISVSRVYQLKGKIGYVKTGLAKQSGIRFPINNVINFLSSL